MLSTVLIVLVIIAVGSRTADNLRVRQQEIILAKLPEAEAVAYYDVLRKRMRAVRVLRAVTLVSMAVTFYAWKYRLAPAVAPAPPPPPPAQTAPPASSRAPAVLAPDAQSL